MYAVFCKPHATRNDKPCNFAQQAFQIHLLTKGSLWIFIRTFSGPTRPQRKRCYLWHTVPAKTKSTRGSVSLLRCCCLHFHQTFPVSSRLNKIILMSGQVSWTDKQYPHHHAIPEVQYMAFLHWTQTNNCCDVFFLYGALHGKAPKITNIKVIQVG